MPEQRNLIKHAPQPQAIAGYTDSTNESPNGFLAYAAWATKPKRTIADLADDQDALSDWRRNLARLRANSTDDPTMRDSES